MKKINDRVIALLGLVAKIEFPKSAKDDRHTIRLTLTGDDNTGHEALKTFAEKELAKSAEVAVIAIKGTTSITINVRKTTKNDVQALFDKLNDLKTA